MSGARPWSWAAALTVAAAPWAFGGTDPSWAALLALGCLVPAAASLATDALRRDAEPAPGRIVAASAALVAVPLLGLLPLPESVRAVLVPGGTALVAAVRGGDGGGTAPLSLTPDATREALALAGAYVGAFLLLRSEARRRGGRDFVVTLLVASGVALAVLGVAQHLSQPDPADRRLYWTVPIAEVGTPFGPYVNRNHFAGALAILAAIAAGETLAAAAERRRARAIAHGLAVVAMLAAIGATGSRGGLLGAGAAALVLVAAAGRGRRLRGAVAALLAAGVVAVVLAWAGALEGLLGRLTTLEGRWVGRFQVQRDAVAVFLGNPWLGTGAGSFEGVHPAFQQVCDDRVFENAHSDWAQILMETGAAGIVAVLLVVRAVVPWMRAGLADDRPARWRTLGPLAGACAAAAHGFVDVGLHVPANALLTVSALSLASAAASPKPSPAGPPAGAVVGAPPPGSA